MKVEGGVGGRAKVGAIIWYIFVEHNGECEHSGPRADPPAINTSIF